jgi:hypothetical protein
MSKDEYDSIANQAGRQTTFCDRSGHLIEAMYLKTGDGSDTHCKVCDVRLSLRIVNVFREENTPPRMISREPTPFEIICAALHAKCGICGHEREGHHHGVHANRGPHDWQPAAEESSHV